MRIGSVTITIAAALVSTYATLAASPEARVVPFSSPEAGQIIVQVYVDGLGPRRFLLDTGSSRTAISERLAREAALPTVAQTTFVTPTGTSLRPMVRLTNLHVGSARVAAVLAPTLSEADVRRLGTDVVGLLGQDFLAQFHYTIDYLGSRLIWHDDDGFDVNGVSEATVRPQRGRVRLWLRPSAGRFLVDLPQVHHEARAAARFVPDSGSDGLVLFSRDRTNQFLADTVAERGQLVSFAGLFGQRVARLVVLRHVQVGEATLRNLPAAVIVDADRGPDAPEDGLLPLSLFASVTFNPRAGYLDVEPR